MVRLYHFCGTAEFLAMRTSRGWWPRGTVARDKGMQARGSRAGAHSCPRNRGVSIGIFEYRCCACLTPSQRKKAGVHSGVCASAKVKRWHGKATFVPCKHNPASMKLCHAAGVCLCVCVCKLAHTFQPSAIRPMYYPTRHQVGVCQRNGPG